MLEAIGIPICPSEVHRDDGSLREHHVVEDQVFGGVANGGPHGTEVAHGLFNRSPGERRIGSEDGPLLGILGEERHGAAELVPRGVGSRHQDGLGEHAEFFGRQAIAVFFGSDHCREEIVLGTCTADGNEVSDVGRQGFAGCVDCGKVLGEVLVEDLEDIGRPITELRPVARWGAEDFADDRDRIRLTHIGDELEPPRTEVGSDEISDERPHHRSMRVDSPRRERWTHQPTESGVGVALHGEDRLASRRTGHRRIGIEPVQLSDEANTVEEPTLTQCGDPFVVGEDRVAEFALGNPGLLCQRGGNRHRLCTREPHDVEGWEFKVRNERGHGAPPPMTVVRQPRPQEWPRVRE